MALTVDQMREILKRQYKGAYKWINRVNKMHDAQVQAVYFRMLREGQVDVWRTCERIAGFR